MSESPFTPWHGKGPPYEVGDRIDTFFGESFVIAAEPYRGKYTQWFTQTVTVRVRYSKFRWLKMAV